MSIFASSYWYLFFLRMNMELVIYSSPRRAILKFANRYPHTSQKWLLRGIQENPTILSPYGMHEQETHRTTNTTKKFLSFLT